MKSIFFSPLFCLALSVFAQQKGSISGTITVEKAQKNEFINILLLRAKDSSLVKGTVSNEAGFFSFESLDNGNYLLLISKTGYASLYSNVIRITESQYDIHLKDLSLKIEPRSLSEILITTRKPFIEQKLDRMIINIENSIISTGSNGLEVLEKLPGISVQPSGAISLKGRSGVKIQVDGRPVNMSSEELADFLRSLTASQMERIEIISNPSARYDAAGTGGIINIRMKKDQKTGLNGAANWGLNFGVYTKLNSGININYRDQKKNIFGSYTLSNRKNLTRIESARKFRNGDDVIAEFIQKGKTIDHTTSHNLRAGVDFFLSKRSILGFLVNGINTKLKPVTNSKTIMYGINGIPDSMLITFIRNNSNWNIYTGNVNFKTGFDSAGKDLAIDLEHSSYNRNNRQFFLNTPQDASGFPTGTTDTLTGNLPAILKITSLKADYVHVLSPTSKLEAGLKTSWIKNDNNLQFFNASGSGNILITALSNHFIYQEHISAFYLNYAHERKKWNFLIGLRGEKTATKGRQVTTGQILMPQNYFQVFPSVFLNYSPNQKHQTGFSYSRRIGRPSYNIVNPFRVFRDPYTYSEGNPFIQPQFSNNFDFNYVLNNKLVFSLGFGNTKNSMTFVVRQDDTTKTTVETFDNLASLEDASFSVSSSIKITSWWSSNNFVGVFYNHFQGMFGNQPVDNSGFMFNASINHSITLPKNYILEFGGFYLSSQPQGIITIAPQGNFNAGIQKSFLQKRGTFRLTFSDIFRTQQFKKTTRFANIDAVFQNTFDSRQVRLAFSWKFGKQTIPADRKRRSASEEEKSRIQLN